MSTSSVALCSTRFTDLWADCYLCHIHWCSLQTLAEVVYLSLFGLRWLYCRNYTTLLSACVWDIFINSPKKWAQHGLLSLQIFITISDGNICICRRWNSSWNDNDTQKDSTENKMHLCAIPLRLHRNWARRLASHPGLDVLHYVICVYKKKYTNKN